MKQWGEEKGKNNFESFFSTLKHLWLVLIFFSNNLQLLSLKSKAAVFTNLGSKLTYVGTRDVS
jgi:hypothetical protein